MIEPYLRKLNLHDSRYVEIDHEEMLSATVYHLDPGGILKIYWTHERFERELHFLTLLQGKYPVPKVFQTLPNEQHPAILMEYLDGLPLKEIGEKTAYAMGQLLARLHLIEVENTCDPLYEMRSYLFRSLSECQDHLPQELLTHLNFYFEEQVQLLEEVDAPCIVHRDFKPANVIANQGHILGVIDWENTKISFAEEDFVSMSLLIWEKDPSSKDPFLAGYASVRTLPNFEKLLPLLITLKSLGTIGFTIQRGTWETVHREIYTQNLERLNSLF